MPRGITGMVWWDLCLARGGKIYFLCISSYGECLCVPNALNIELLDVQNVQ